MFFCACVLEIRKLSKFLSTVMIKVVKLKVYIRRKFGAEGCPNEQ